MKKKCTATNSPNSGTNVLFQFLFLGFISVFMFCSKKGSSNIEDFFLLLPDDAALELDSDERKTLLKEESTNTNGPLPYSLDKFDVMDNGYMKIKGDNFEGVWEMYYDKIHRIIAVNLISCGPVCYSEYLKLYKYNNKSLEMLNNKMVLPDISLDDFIAENPDEAELAKIKEQPFTYAYKLPQSGGNIVAEYQWAELFEKEEIQKALKGDKIELVWQDDKLKKGNVIF